MPNKSYTSGTVIDSGSLNDFNTATYNLLTAVAGTNTITATGPLSFSAYAGGKDFEFVPAVTNTGAVTININGLGARAITKYGTTPLVAGDLVAGAVVRIIDDGTRFQLLNPQVTDIAHGGTGATTAAQALANLGAIGRLVNVQVITATGIPTYNSATTRILCYVIGAGGAGGGCQATAAGQNAAGGGGGGGATSIHLATSGFVGQTATIGAGGVPVSGGSGGLGGDTTFLGVTAKGGSGGSVGTAIATPAVAAGGGSIYTSSGANIQNGPTTAGSPGFVLTIGGSILGGNGGGTLWFPGNAQGSPLGLGSNATSIGGGGGGSSSVASTAARAGGSGASGAVVIFEYS